MDKEKQSRNSIEDLGVNLLVYNVLFLQLFTDSCTQDNMESFSRTVITVSW